GFAVEAANNVVVLSAQLDASHVLQPHDRTIRSGTEDEVAKLLLRREPSLRANGVSELLAGRCGTAADFAGRVDGVLTADRVDNLRDGDVEFGQLVRLHPDSHRILPGAKDRHLRNARHTTE